MPRPLITLTLLLITLAATAQIAVDQVPNVHVQDARRYVSDPAGVLSPGAVAALDARLAQIWQQTTAEPVVVVVDRIPDDTDIDTYATDLFTLWGIGKADNDNGLLVVVSRDDRRAAIRTGYGVEGVLPDIVAGRILRNVMFPRFREGDYDGGLTATVDSIGRVLTDPTYAAELRSASMAGKHAKNDSVVDGLWGYLGFCVVAALILLIAVLVMVAEQRKKEPGEAYTALERWKMPLLMGAFFTLGLGIPAYAVLKRAMRRTRTKNRHCPNCHTLMVQKNEEEDNAYLTPAQDTEEQLNSVDYDVWVCPNCNEVDIFPYVNKNTTYTPCTYCGARACRLETQREVVKATRSHGGRGVRVYRCKNCGRLHEVPYVIPMVATPLIVPGIGGRGGGGLGGFSGGSFGGGMTGGGGASGGW